MPDPTKFDRFNILIFNPLLKRRQKSITLRRALLEHGFEYQCNICGQGSIWHGKKLTMEVHHKDSNWKNNQSTNLEFLCPNCHDVITRLDNEK